MLRAMPGDETKGWMGGNMKFGVGEDVEEEAKGPLLPLRVLVITDLVPRAPYNAGASAPAGALRVNLTEFDELFGKIRPRAAFEVPSVLAEGRNVRVDLSPTSLKSFRPDGLVAEIPLLRSLLDGRLVLDRLNSGALSIEQAHAELDRLWSGSSFVREVLGLLPGKQAPARPVAMGPQAAPNPGEPAAPPPVEANVDALLDMVDLGGGSGPSVASPQREPERAPTPAVVPTKFSDLIASVARSARSSPEKVVRPTEAIARVEKALGAQIGAILQHPEVRRLEQAWRGLRFFVERAQGHTGIRIDVVSARPDEAEAAMTRAIRAGAATEPPVSCAIVDLHIDGTPVSFQRLEAIAGAAETYSVPAIVNGAPRLLGLDDLRGVEALDNKGALFHASKQVPWQSAVAKPAMRWVAIAMNGVLSRGPYDKSTSRVREAAIKELPADDGAYVWLAPAFVVGALVLASFRDTGWPCRIIGARSGGIVGNLQVREVKDTTIEGQEGVAIPTEAFVSTDSQRELAKCGVLLLAAAPNSDAVYVLSAPTAYVTPPKRTYDSASTEPEVRLDRISLVDQLFVARIVQFLKAFCSKLPATSPPAEVQPVVEGALWALFDNAPPAGLEIGVKAHSSGGGTLVEIAVKPRRYLGVSIEEVSLEMALG
jgi:type VI secretion system protein ImpC